MKILKLKKNKNGSVLMTYSLSKGEEEIFKSVARRKHKRFDKLFIRKEMIQAFERLEESKYDK